MLSCSIAVSVASIDLPSSSNLTKIREAFKVGTVRYAGEISRYVTRY